jgi:cell division protein FtsB
MTIEEAKKQVVVSQRKLELVVERGELEKQVAGLHARIEAIAAEIETLHR